MGALDDPMEGRNEMRDLIRRRGEHKRDWSTGSETHRGRICVEVMSGAEGGEEEVRLVLAQNTSKFDHASKRQFEMVRDSLKAWRRLGRGGIMAHVETRPGERSKEFHGRF